MGTPRGKPKLRDIYIVAFEWPVKKANSCDVNVFTMVSGIIPTFGECIPLWTQNDTSLFPWLFRFRLHLPHWILSIDQDKAGFFAPKAGCESGNALLAHLCVASQMRDFSRPGVENGENASEIWDCWGFSNWKQYKTITFPRFWIGWEALKLIWGTSHWVSDWVRFYAQLFVASSWSQYTFRYIRTTYIHNHVYI